MDSDKDLFRKAMAHVTPLKGSKKNLSQKKTCQAIKPNSETNTPPPKTYHVSLSNPWDATSLQPESCLSFGKNRIQRSQFHDLKKGIIRPEARLDMHGFRLEEAADALAHFVHESRESGIRSVLIIHGKGGRFNEPPILKNHVNHWLKQLPDVLAFHSAIPRDGGHGAVYVLLNQRKTRA